MHGYIMGDLQKQVLNDLNFFPVVAFVGPQQSGKSTIIKPLVWKISDQIRGYKLEIGLNCFQ